MTNHGTKVRFSTSRSLPIPTPTLRSPPPHPQFSRQLTVPPSTQNTTDPEGRKHPISEGAGAVASDSLAAESVRAGGGFASNRDAAPLGVKGGNSTLANTDTRSAVKLEAARDKASRRDEGLDERVKYPEGAGGQGGFRGRIRSWGMRVDRRRGGKLRREMMRRGARGRAAVGEGVRVLVVMVMMLQRRLGRIYIRAIRRPRTSMPVMRRAGSRRGRT